MVLVYKIFMPYVSFAHLGTYEDMLVANNTDLKNRSTTSLAGT